MIIVCTQCKTEYELINDRVSSQPVEDKPGYTQWGFTCPDCQLYTPTHIETEAYGCSKAGLRNSRLCCIFSRHRLMLLAGGRLRRFMTVIFGR